MNDDEEDIIYLINKQNIEACPACGSVFLVHQCHADPVRTR